MAAGGLPEAPVMAGAQGHARSGARWIAASQVARQIFQGLALVALARLLTPGDFGILAMAMVFGGFTAVLKDFGVGAATIHAERVTPGLLSTCFWASAGIGVVVSALLWWSAPFIGAMYDEPMLAPVLRIIAINPILIGVASVPMATLERQLRFRAAALIDVAAVGVGALVGVGAAVVGFGVWSLVLQLLAQYTTSMILAVSISSWKPTLHFDAREAANVMGFGGNLTAFQIVNYFGRNGDYFLIGLYLGSEAVGVYTLAYRVVFYLVQAISGVAGRVLFPIYARLRGDVERLGRSYTRAVQVTFALAVPALVTLFALRTHVVAAFFGAEWMAAGPVVALLVPTAILQTVLTTVGSLYQAMGRTGLLFAWGLGATALTVVAFLVGIQYGLLGIASGYLGAMIVLTLPGLAIPLSLIELPVRRFLWQMAPIALCGLVTLVFLMVAEQVLRSNGHVLVLAVGAPSGAMVFALALRIVAADTFRQVVGLIPVRRRREFGVVNGPGVGQE